MMERQANPQVIAASCGQVGLLAMEGCEEGGAEEATMGAFREIGYGVLFYVFTIVGAIAGINVLAREVSIGVPLGNRRMMRYKLRTLLTMAGFISITFAIVGWICGYRLAWSTFPPGNVRAFQWEVALMGGMLGAGLSVILGSLANHGFRFTIRDIVWLTLVVAFGASWSVQRVAAHRLDRLAVMWKNRAEGLRFELLKRGYQAAYVQEALGTQAHIIHHHQRTSQP